MATVSLNGAWVPGCEKGTQESAPGELENEPILLLFSGLLEVYSI